MNKKTKIILIIIMLMSLLLLSFYLFIRFFSVSFKVNKKVQYTVNTIRDLSINAKFLGKEIDKEIKINNNIDWNKVGKYYITYSYKTPLFITAQKIVEVNLVDDVAPEITLNGGDEVILIFKQEFIDPGYNVSDNYDKNIEVKVKGKVDSSTPGNYYLTYSAIDGSNNKQEIVRKVSVLKESPVDVDISLFNINDYYDDKVVLSKTNDYGQEYINKIAFVGDSIPWVFGLNGVWDSNKVYAAPCTGPTNIYTQKAYWNNVLTNYTIPELIKNNKPEYILVSIGFCEIVSLRNVPLFVENYKKFIEDIKRSNPDTKIILNSMNPVINETLRGHQVPTNKQVNEYNYYIALIAKEYKLKYLDSASILKNNLGLAEPTLTGSDGYHPNILGMKKMVEYIRNHGYEGEKN